MRIPRVPHRWSLSPREAIAVQRRLAASVQQTRPRAPLRLAAGLDAAFSRDGEHCIAGVVLWDLRERAVVEQRVAMRKLRFPYIPGLLSFREAPSLLAALRKLRRAPDVLLCDGHGWAHPRRFGIACHVGVLTGLPSAGCAKSRLVGSHREPGRERGSQTPLEDDGEIIGTVLRTRPGVKPVFVSVGHRIDLDSAERLVLDCGGGYRLPEPVRLADRLVAAEKRDSANLDRHRPRHRCR
jgi:deoxyribonuclease V